MSKMLGGALLSLKLLLLPKCAFGVRRATEVGVSDLIIMNQSMAPGDSLQEVDSVQQGETLTSPFEFSIGTYNLLAERYAVKRLEREGIKSITKEGRQLIVSNWVDRWPILQNILQIADWEVLTFQEVQQVEKKSSRSPFHLVKSAMLEDVTTWAKTNYDFQYFPHPKRYDGLMILWKKGSFEQIGGSDNERNVKVWNGSVVSACVDLRPMDHSEHIRVCTSHEKGPGRQGVQASLEQNKNLATVAVPSTNLPAVTVVSADFNEDFTETEKNHTNKAIVYASNGTKTDIAVGCPLGPAWKTLQRDSGLNPVSRPAHKQGREQESGKGKVDWIFIKSNTCETRLFRPVGGASWRAIAKSHPRFGVWPSDHGAEAFSVQYTCNSA